jgi:hypothetical protein
VEVSLRWKEETHW